MNRVVSLWIWLFAGLASVRSASKWSYVGRTGPHYWHEIFPHACGGESQSPIDLKPEQTMYDPDLKEFAIWYDPPKPNSKMLIKNTGYTVQVDLEGDFFLSNGGLSHVYKAVQFHFHWGHKSHQGSEHLKEGQASPIELHVVSFNQDLYSDIGEAIQKPGGLAVLGVLFELSEEDNPSFDYIIRGMRHIRNPDKVNKVELPLFSLRDLLPDSTDRYFRYNGSLTTPGCFETVTWTVFDRMQTISHRQMEQFRKVLQFKRKYHQHNKQSQEGKNTEVDSGRHKRETTNSERIKENNAKQVLDELGINGKDSGFEREIFKHQLVNAQKQATKDTVGSEMTNLVEGGDKALEALEHKYEQDFIVNNFRPVQPINGRAVFRSFKLREVVVINQLDEQPADVAETQPVKYDTDDNKGNSANNLSPFSLSVTILLFIFANRMLH